MSGRDRHEAPTRATLRLIYSDPDPAPVPEPVAPCEPGAQVQLLIFAAHATVLTEAYIADIAALGPDAWELRAVVSDPRTTFALASLADPSAGTRTPRLCPPPERGQGPDRSTRPGQTAGSAPADRPTPSGSTHRKDES